MSLLGALNTGARGLGLASAGIDVTTQNVTGANTPGYTRRSLHSKQLSPVQEKGLWIGQGAQAMSVARSADRLLGVRIIDATGSKAQSSTLAENLKIAESYFDGTTGTGIGEALAAVFDALSSATSDPSDTSLRQGVIAAASTFASTVSRTAKGLADTVTGIEEQIGSSLDSVNADLAEIASLNARIGKSSATSGPADLLDRRDQLVLDLAERIGATAELKADGQAVVYVGGNAIVSGGDYRAFSTGKDPDGNTTIQLAMDNGSMDVGHDIGGNLGGLLDARGKTESWADQLDSFAFSIADAMNKQNAAGYDASGAAGGDIFTLTSTSSGAAAGLSLDATLADDPSLLAFAGAATAAAGDSDNLSAMLDLETDTTIFAGGEAAQATISALTANVGSEVKNAESDSEAQTALVDDLDTLRESTSGVDTDEEATHLLEYQAAYRAAAKVVSACDELLRTLLQIAG